uniref:Kinase non-catalytic C-lobe domain (KIND) containing 1 n=1 Tax=Nothobranchius kuhntae TaxID=321403 RepID=A0A1A8IFU6_NOTKU
MYGSTSHQQRAAVPLGTPSDPQQLLAYADRVSNWSSAEILTWDSVKTQVALLTRYLCMGKFCYETRNFASAMQVLGALENGTEVQYPCSPHHDLQAYLCLRNAQLANANIHLLEGCIVICYVPLVD